MNAKEFVAEQERIARKLKIEFGAEKYDIKYTEFFYIEPKRDDTLPHAIIPHSKVAYVRGKDKNRIEV